MIMHIKSFSLSVIEDFLQSRHEQRFVRFILAAVFSAVLLLLASPCVNAEVYFDDAADIYGMGEEAVIIKMMEEASAHTGWNYGIVTSNTDFSTAADAKTSAESIYNSVFGEDSSGVLYMCDVGYRYIVVEGDAQNYVSGARFENMLEKIKEYYFEHNDMGCARTFIESTSDYYDRGKGGFDLDMNMFIISVFLGLIVAAGTAFGISRHYAAHEKPATNNYLDVRKFNMYRNSDTLIHSSTKIEQVGSGKNSFGNMGDGGFGGFGGFGGHR